MPLNPDPAATGMPRAQTRPINWPVTVIVFFAGSVLLWADRSNFSVAAAAWAKDLNWTPSTIGLMLSAFSLGYIWSFSRSAGGLRIRSARGARLPVRWPAGRSGCC